ncbi:MAG: DUF4326 domain-containing protein [Shewanella sp.]
MKIVHIENKHLYRESPSETAVYIGRGTILGNPYSHIPSSFPNIIRVKNRGEACKKYDELFHKILNDPHDFRHAELTKQLDSLVDILNKEGSLTLLCYCAPHKCHGETIAAHLEDRVNGKIIF